MGLLGRLRRSLRERGLSGTLQQLPRAAARPLLLGRRTKRSARRAAGLVSAQRPVLLHLGSGPDPRPGWINVDLYFPAELCLDLTRPLPLPDGCVDAIFSQHFIEHLPKAQAADLLVECARVLKPGGWLRCSTPDLAHYVGQWIERRARGAADAADGLNDIMRLHDHLYIYDEAALADLMARAGLAEIARQRPQESRCEHLRGLETRLAEASAEEARQDLILEARRPEA